MLRRIATALLQAARFILSPVRHAGALVFDFRLRASLRGRYGTSTPGGRQGHAAGRLPIRRLPSRYAGRVESLEARSMISGVPGGDFGWPADFPPAEVQPLPPDLIAPVQVGPRELSPAVETKIQLLSEGMAQLSPACQAAVIDHALRELGYLPPQFDAILGGNDKVVKLLSSYGSSDSASGAQRIALMRARTWLREYVFVLRPSSAEPAGPAPLMNPAPGPDQAGGSNPR